MRATLGRHLRAIGAVRAVGAPRTIAVQGGGAAVVTDSVVGQRARILAQPLALSE